MEKNNIENVNDLILFNWLKYASEGLKKIGASTEYDALRNMVNTLYSSSFTPVVADYFDYVYNKTISPLPENINGQMIEDYHNGYRKYAKEFNDKLNESLFNRLTFEESPYAMAILKGENNQDLTINNKLEVFDEHGNLIDSKGNYRVYVPADAAKQGNENMTLPADAIIVDDLTYVLDSYLN